LAAACFVAGCAATDGAYSTISEVGAENSLLRFSTKAVKGGAVRRVAYADPWEYEEYADFRSDELRFEVFYIHRVGRGTAVEYPFAIPTMIDTWNYNSGAGKTWRKKGHVDGAVATIWYQRYTRLPRQEACIGFQAEWAHSTYDPTARPGKLLFGYLCAAPGKTLSDPAVGDFLANITVRDLAAAHLALNFGETSTVPPPARRKALAIAQGGPKNLSGNKRFPFGFVVTSDSATAGP